MRVSVRSFFGGSQLIDHIGPSLFHSSAYRIFVKEQFALEPKGLSCLLRPKIPCAASERVYILV